MTRSTLELFARTIGPLHGRAWHGGVTPAGAVRGVSAAKARRVPGPRRKSIWELVLHIAYWKYAVRRHLEARDIPRFPRSPSNWPAVPAQADEAAWRADRALLEAEHKLFVAAARRFDPKRLDRRPPGGKRWTYGDLILGILAHDAYHTGQIQLLKRLWK